MVGVSPNDGVRIKNQEANFKGGLFIVFENCFVFSKIRKTIKTYLVFSFFLFEKHKEKKNNKFKEQVKC